MKHAKLWLLYLGKSPDIFFIIYASNLWVNFRILLRQLPINTGISRMSKRKNKDRKIFRKQKKSLNVALIYRLRNSIRTEVILS